MSAMTNLEAGRETARLQQQAAGERLLGMANDAMLAVMLSVGHRTGLLDSMAGQPAATVAEVAARAGLAERYVREWLAAMTAGGIVAHDPEAMTFWLPDSYAAWLTRAAGPDNVAMTTQFVGVVAEVEDQIVDRFRNGGGVTYGCYHRFHDVMAEESGARMDRDLIATMLPMADGLPERLQRGIDVLEIGCGKAHPTNLLAQAYPQSRFVAYDISEETTAAGRAEAAAMGLTNVDVRVQDIAVMSHDAEFDLVLAFDVVHDQVDPAGVLAAVHRALRPGGLFFMQDIRGSSVLAENRDHPLAALLYSISCLHCMPVSLAGGGPGLGTMWGRQVALKMLAEAGFRDVTVQSQPDDLINDTYLAYR